MTMLKDSTVHRGGVTSRYISHETNQVEVFGGNNLNITFRMSSKGGGTSHVEAHIGKEDFPILLRKMIRVDRQATMEAMAKELNRQILAQPDHDEKTTRRAEDAIVDLASDKFNVAPYGKDDAERFTLNAVRKLVTELRASENEEGAETETVA